VAAGQRHATEQLEQQERREEVANAREHGGQWNRFAQGVCIIAPTNTIQISVIG